MRCCLVPHPSVAWTNRCRRHTPHRRTRRTCRKRATPRQPAFGSGTRRARGSIARECAPVEVVVVAVIIVIVVRVRRRVARHAPLCRSSAVKLLNALNARRCAHDGPTPITPRSFPSAPPPSALAAVPGSPPPRAKNGDHSSLLSWWRHARRRWADVHAELRTCIAHAAGSASLRRWRNFAHASRDWARSSIGRGCCRRRRTSYRSSCARCRRSTPAASCRGRR